MLQGIGYNPYNSYNLIGYSKLTENSGVKPAANPQQNEALKVQVNEAANKSAAAAPIASRANAPLEDISLSLSKPSEFDMKGSQSDINSLDINKAVSDMQKDEALMQYRYFVGNDTPIFQSEDGIVLPKVSM